MKHVRTFFIGIILGVANVIPGVSGGTMAVVFGVYDRLVGVLTLNFATLRRNLAFIAALAAGLVVSILTFAKIVTWLLARHPVPVNFFFEGIILGSVPFIASLAGFGRGRSVPSSVVARVALAIAGVAVMVAMAVVKADDAEAVRVTAFTLPVAVWLFAMGLVAAITMLMPGISGSFVLVLFGAYATVMGSVSDFNIPLMAPFAFGVGIGLLVGAGIVRFLLARSPYLAYSLILGLVIGSLIPVFPGISGSASTLIASAISLAGGFVLSYRFAKGDASRGASAGEANA